MPMPIYQVGLIQSIIFMRNFFSIITVLFLTVNILNANVDRVETDVNYIENDNSGCDQYAQDAAAAESDAYGGNGGYSFEDWFHAYAEYFNYCMDVTGDIGAQPQAPAFIK